MTLEVYVVQRDMGYDGLHLVGVSRSHLGARSLAVAHAFVGERKFLDIEKWVEIKDDILFGRAWITPEGVEPAYRITKTELTG